MTMRLAAARHLVTVVDPAATMLAAAVGRLAARPELADRVQLLNAGFDALTCGEPRLAGPRRRGRHLAHQDRP
ncbi:hypothetical protein ACFYZU_30075 [Streptomyces sp. NPDC001651]|uniref:hypothetical protein n=1 Tax=unclassified Streptomyces TaxID=2593676 RepID=UPI00368C77F0